MASRKFAIWGVESLVVTALAIICEHLVSFEAAVGTFVFGMLLLVALNNLDWLKEITRRRRVTSLIAFILIPAVLGFCFWLWILLRAPKPQGVTVEALARTQTRSGLVPEFNDIHLGRATKETPDGRKAAGAAVLLLVTVRNYGGPTSASDYQLFVKLTDGRIEKGELRPVGAEKLRAATISGKPVDLSTDPLESKTQVPIPKDGSVQGRLTFFFVGADVDTLARAGTIVVLSVKDSQNRGYAVEKVIQAVEGTY